MKVGITSNFIHIILYFESDWSRIRPLPSTTFNIVMRTWICRMCPYFVLYGLFIQSIAVAFEHCGLRACHTRNPQCSNVYIVYAIRFKHNLNRLYIVYVKTQSAMFKRNYNRLYYSRLQLRIACVSQPAMFKRCNRL